jgi:hypothetical protein
LHRQTIAGIEQFAKQGEARACVGVARPKDFVAVLGPQLVQVLSGKGAICDNALRFFSIDNFPSFTDGLIARQRAAESRGEFSPAPDAFHVERLESDRFHGFSAV